MVLHQYTNGNINVVIYDNGTKIRQYYGRLRPNFPECIDIKITEYCDLNCPFCYANSVKQGTHSNLQNLSSLLKGLPPGVEIALGGGNPLSHPQLYEFLQKVKDMKLVPNLTVNQRHLPVYGEYLKQLVNEGLIYGIGISIVNDEFSYLEQLMRTTSNVVCHLVLGIVSINTINKLMQLPYLKILFLGYKRAGRGIKYYKDARDQICKNITSIKSILPLLRCIAYVGFDTLALRQLQVKNALTPQEWQRYYMGNDGQLSMYLDCVNGYYSRNSYMGKKFKFECGKDSVISMFQMFSHKPK